MRVFLATVLLFGVSAGTLALSRRINGTDGGNIYALLVAGSYTWENYRHQVFTFICVHISMLYILLMSVPAAPLSFSVKISL